MRRSFDAIVERDSEGYCVGSVPALPGCHTKARSLDKLHDRLREAIELYLEVDWPEGTELDLVRLQRITVKQ